MGFTVIPSAGQLHNSFPTDCKRDGGRQPAERIRGASSAISEAAAVDVVMEPSTKPKILAWRVLIPRRIRHYYVYEKRCFFLIMVAVVVVSIRYSGVCVYAQATHRYV
jgi:hypothetical protein